MKFGYFNQLQMPKPWPENAEAKLYKEAMDEAVLAEEVALNITGRLSTTSTRR